ncbi:MAG: energy-coupling factor ABC transporter ATP-binding protein [Anaerolineae bacterium]|nr:energy-coupling factor ABC transporter ATP-binding protein [Anaerolineae bacterium]
MILFEQLTYTYPGAAEPVLRNLSLEIDEGEFVLVVGPSGAGKSTLLRCLNGLVPHFYGGTLSGRVRAGGRDPVALGPRGMADLVGFVLQDPEAQFVVDRVEDELAFALENQGIDPLLMRKRVEEVVDQLNIAHLRGRSVSTLSGGERQRVAIAAVMTLQPQVLVLDEPTSQLDPQGAEEVLDTLVKLNRDLGLTVILSEHRLERVVEYVDRILYLPAPGEEPVLDDPRTVLAQIDITPPLVTLAKALNWSPLPLTIKEGRRFAREVASYQLQDPNDKVQARNTQYPIPDSRFPNSPISLSIHNLTFSYNGHPALNDVTLDVREGEFVALMGRNGSGKTTLLKQMVGLLKPDRGRVEVGTGNGHGPIDTRRAAVEQIIRLVGYVPQNPDALLFNDTVVQELDFTRRGHDMPPGDYDALLAALGLLPYAAHYPRDLSVGERQRVALASILVAEPQVLLLDEPTRGLDYRQKEALAEILAREKARGRTVVMATHDVELAASCADRVIILGDGQVVVDGPARQVMSESLVFSSQVNKLFRDPAMLTVEDVLAHYGAPSLSGGEASDR